MVTEVVASAVATVEPSAGEVIATTGGTLSSVSGSGSSFLQEEYTVASNPIKTKIETCFKIFMT
jgi:hypothetical protein